MKLTIKEKLVAAETALAEIQRILAQSAPYDVPLAHHPAYQKGQIKNTIDLWKLKVK